MPQEKKGNDMLSSESEPGNTTKPSGDIPAPIAAATLFTTQAVEKRKKQKARPKVKRPPATD